MSTLTEIEAAAERLPLEQQKKLLEHLSMRLQRQPVSEADPFAALIGAFAGRSEATGRHAKEVLYGRGESE